MPAPRPCCGWSARADGAYYEIDLTDDNVDALRETFSDYIAAARKANGRSVRTTAGSVGDELTHSAAIQSEHVGFLRCIFFRVGSVLRIDVEFDRDVFCGCDHS